MRSTLLSLCMLGGALAARSFLNEPDTGFDEVFADLAAGELPPLDKLVGLPDFDAAARRHLPTMNYTYYRNGAGGEWSYRNNLEIYNRYRLKPRTMVDITNIESTLPTTILGHNFSAPFFISPCARGGYGSDGGEKGLVEGAADGNILYMPALYASLTIEEITAFKQDGQVTFQQVYLDSNDTATQIIFDRAKTADAKAIVFTVDSAADGNRHRAARYGVGSADSAYTVITWDLYDHLATMTDLPIILKGIQTVEDAQEAVRRKVPAIYLSNHGGRQIDGARSPLEVAIDIHQQAPEVFSQLEVYADGGVRYGADVVKLLALGVKAVGLGRPFMYANVYGTEGVSRAIELLKHEIAIDAANAGVADLKKIDPNVVDWTPNWTSA
ncbi:FMN-dependent alpha-hydroxy acid dehydrogenase [Annulohypoxylon bovei var. microspora]|nr:FMN-dependent alpha-hydroxy acid dehydrogenase [Annulohypoxylon bovei var. microspora]